MKRQNGLTTVELIVTLFLASMFIISGYQLYRAVSGRSGESRELAEASSLAYKALRSSEHVVVTNSCDNPLISSVALGTTTLPDPSAEISRCKPFASNNIVRTTVSVNYGESSDRRKAIHATYTAP